VKRLRGLRPGRTSRLGIVAFLALVVIACSSPTAAPTPSGDPLDGPLTVARQGSFFVGGETKSVGTPGGRGGAGEITIHQMYVQYAERVNAAGGDVVMMHLPAMGIHGNSHMFMQDRNSLELADLILGWIDDHVGTRRTPV